MLTYHCNECEATVVLHGVTPPNPDTVSMKWGGAPCPFCGAEHSFSGVVE